MEPETDSHAIGGEVGLTSGASLPGDGTTRVGGDRTAILPGDGSATGLPGDGGGGAGDSTTLPGAAILAGEGTTRQWFLDMSRRGFLRTGSIGVIAAGIIGSVPGLSSVLTSAESDAPAVGGSAAVVGGAAPEVEGDTSGIAQSFSARVSNLSTGEMKVFVGNQTVRIQDPELAQRISRAARAAQSAGR